MGDVNKKSGKRRSSNAHRKNKHVRTLVLDVVLADQVKTYLEDASKTAGFFMSFNGLVAELLAVHMKKHGYRD